ncbi:hypothetical protein ACHWQZ_G017441 [Mnemiopsis leidyi]
MSQRTVGKFKRIFKSYGIPISISLGLIYGVSKLVGSPSEVYREIEQTKSGRSEMEYFDKEVSRMIQEICVDGKNGVKYWHEYAQERNAAEKLKRQKIQELIKSGRVSEKEVISELRNVDNVVIQDSISMLKVSPEEVEAES